MTSEEPDKLERNLAALLRHGVAAPDAERTARARREFLSRAADPGAPVARPWKLPALAAALLVGATVFWAVRKEEVAKRPPPPPPTPEVVDSARLPFAAEGNDAVKGVLRMERNADPGAPLRFEGRSTLPDGLLLRIEARVMTEQISNDRLVAAPGRSITGKPVIEKGQFVFEWDSAGPGRLRIDVTAPDDLQSLPMVRQLKMKEADRAWTFEFQAWDGGLLNQSGAALVDLAEVAGEALPFLSDCEKACATEASFKESKDRLLKEMSRLQGRIDRIRNGSLLPAAIGQLSTALRDLETAFRYFKWEAGKPPGPSTYYENNKPLSTSRGEPFSFAALRKDVEDSVRVGGRETALWFLGDYRRAGEQPGRADLLVLLGKLPGMAEFADRLKSPAKDQLDRLESEIRILKSDKGR